MKNRKREICTSGSVRDEDGQPPHLLGHRNFLHLAAGAAALPAVSRMASAQAYPTRPVRVIVPFAPAGDTDLVARLMGQWLSERLGQPFRLARPLVQRELVPPAVELVAAILKPVRPRDQYLTSARGAHLVGPVSVD
jgi:hypothetical protein